MNLLASLPDKSGFLSRSYNCKSFQRLHFFEFLCIVYVNFTVFLEQFLLLHDLMEQFTCMFGIPCIQLSSEQPFIFHFFVVLYIYSFP